MSSYAGTSRNLGATIAAKPAGGGTLVAAGAGDATLVTGTAIDRLNFQTGVLAIAGRTTLAAAETLKFTVTMEDSADNSAWTAYSTLATAATVATGALAAADFVAEYNLDLTPCKRYVRFKFTPDASAGAADIASWGATLICGGARTIPV